MGTCHQATLYVSESKCAPQVKVAAGCLPGGRAFQGWGCYVRKSNGEVIQTTDAPPITLDGIESCYTAGITESISGISPYECSDGGT
jgi:hypothetical protein